MGGTALGGRRAVIDGRSDERVRKLKAKAVIRDQASIFDRIQLGQAAAQLRAGPAELVDGARLRGGYDKERRLRGSGEARDAFGECLLKLAAALEWLLEWCRAVELLRSQLSDGLEDRHWIAPSRRVDAIGNRRRKALTGLGN